MKVLNDKGWGLVTLITFICVFALFLLVLSFLIGNFNHNDSPGNEESYISYIVL